MQHNEMSAQSQPTIITQKYPNQIRLLINKQCNYHCSFPGTCIKWCHEDGAHSLNNTDNATWEDFVFLSRVVTDEFGIDRIKIGAMEPLLFPDLAKLIVGLKKLNSVKLSLTTNGYFLKQNAPMLKQSGIDAITVSVHAFNRQDYQQITGVDGFDQAISGILEAKKIGIENIHVNRVMLNFKDSWSDLNNFLEWARANDITAKLYQLIWCPEFKDSKLYYENYQHWFGLSGELNKNYQLVGIDKFQVPGRERLTWISTNGRKIITDTFLCKPTSAEAAICQNCPSASYCREGLMSYGYEFNADLVMSPCLLRNDLSTSLFDAVKERDAKAIVKIINSQVNKLVTHKV